MNTVFLMTQEDVLAQNNNIDKFLIIKIFITVLIINATTILH